MELDEILRHFDLPGGISGSEQLRRKEDGEPFYLTREDRDFSAGYYYDRLLRDMGVGPGDWRRTLELFLFYEYCEWVFIGNKYKGANEAYYRKYLALAKRQAEKLLAKF